MNAPKWHLRDEGRPRLPTRDSDQRLTVRLASVVGADAVQTPDPSEDYHEASRIDPGVVDPTVVGAAHLDRSVAMKLSVARSVKRHPHLPVVALPLGDAGNATLAQVLRTRRSRRAYLEEPLRMKELATLLGAAYGVTGEVPGTTQTFRAAPSGGALYPLELYVACRLVEGLEAALYHYDPLRHALERMHELGTAEQAGELTPYPALLAECQAFVVVTATFWRSRFKYGARAYRFALLEAGHVAQSFLLAAEALGLAATPIGGFFDRRVDDFVGVDGLYESSLYLLPVGRRADR